MEEIIIEEKKYVSSKQAAKMTGYAKDYIGQLCREGRVPARLVGRSWYVLESAIQDHRFGNQEISKEDKVKSEKPPSLPVQMREFPRYESAQAGELPSLQSINRLRDMPEVAVSSEEGQQEVMQSPQYLQDSWQAWFTNTSDVLLVDDEADIEDDDASLPPVEPEEIEETQTDTDTGAVNVPLHTIDTLPVAEPIVEEIHQKKTTKPRASWRTGKKTNVFRVMHIVGVVFAVAAVVLAVGGSGYLDEYVMSSKPASILSGITLYTR